MAPRPTAPRLKDITPDTVAAFVGEIVCEHLGALLLQLAPAADHIGRVVGAGKIERLTPELVAAESGLCATVRQLVQYAKTGDAGDWEHPATAVPDATQAILGALWSRAVEPVGGAPLDATDANEATPLGVAICAAWARVRVTEGEDVPATWLGHLVGLSEQQVRTLRRGGEIPTDAAGLRDWCHRRGVAGIVEPEARPRGAFAHEDWDRIDDADRAAWTAGNAEGRGYAVGLPTDSVDQAAKRDGMEVMLHGGDVVLARVAGRRVLIGNAGGPWAVDIG